MLAKRMCINFGRQKCWIALILVTNRTLGTHIVNEDSSSSESAMLPICISLYLNVHNGVGQLTLFIYL